MAKINRKYKQLTAGEISRSETPWFTVREYAEKHGVTTQTVYDKADNPNDPLVAGIFADRIMVNNPLERGKKHVIRPIVGGRTNNSSNEQDHRTGS
jgi:hypothetical protein